MIPTQLDDEAVLDGLVVDASDSNLTRHEIMADEALITEALAVETVRRVCNQHRCVAVTVGDCRHPDHHRDVNYLNHMLTMLGLPGSCDRADGEKARAAFTAQLKS